MQEKNNSKIIIIIGALLLAVAIAGGIFWANSKKQSDTSHDPTTSNIVNEATDPAIAYLQNLDSFVYRNTYLVNMEYEDADGQTQQVQRETVQKVSVTPTLQVNILESMRSLDEDEIDPNAQHPSYVIFNGDGTTTNYTYSVADSATKGQDVWYTGNSDDTNFNVPKNRFYAHTWLVDDTPVKVSTGVYTTTKSEERGQYTFYFDAANRLTKVTWKSADDSISEIYEILDEPVITSVPQEIIDRAVPFSE